MIQNPLAIFLFAFLLTPSLRADSFLPFQPDPDRFSPSAAFDLHSLNTKANILDTPTPPSEPLITYADTTKAHTLLGYNPKTQVPQGLANFITWMREEKII